MIRFATIGTNFIVDEFVAAASRSDALFYQAVYSRKEENAKAFMKKHGALGIYTDLQKLAEAEDVDAVYVASPNSLHYEQSALMLKHGKHVLCEKTITSNERELQTLIKLAKDHDVLIMEAMRSVFDPAFAVIESQLHRLGTIRRATFQYCQYSSRYDKYKAGIVENAFKPEFSNGALMDIGVYCVHPMVRLFGMPERIAAQGLILPNGVDGAGTIMASYGSMEAVLLYSKISNNRMPSEIQGEDGTMVIRNINEPYEVIFYDKKGKEEVLFSLPGNSGLDGEVREWVRLMESGERNDHHNRNSVMELRVMDEARRQIGIVFPADSLK